MNQRLKLYTFDNKFDSICRLFDYLLTIPVNCNALKTLHVWENVMNFTLV